MLKGDATLIALNFVLSTSNTRPVFAGIVDVVRNLFCFPPIDVFSVSTAVVNVLVLTLALIAVCIVEK